MEPAEEFRKHTQECRAMARFTRDPASKTTWLALADRWAKCAEMEERTAALKREVGGRNRKLRQLRHAS